MKKIFLSFLAIIAMVGMVSAQRTWAYGLNMTQEGDNYTFVFKSTTAATAANLVFTDAAGEVAGKVALENVVAGENTKVLALADIPGEGTLNWAVELTGAAIEGVVELTADAAAKYFYYLLQGVAVNVNPESSYFGNIYVAEPYAGASDGASAHSKTQKAGIYVYDAALNIENYAEGYVPSNVTINATDKYKTLHRIVVDPVTDDVVFTQSSGAYVWSANPADLKAEATNLAAGLGIALTQSVCFDGQGVMYVMDASVAGGGTLYKVVDGVATALVSTEKWANDRNSLASDGRGGVWVGQYRAALDGYNYLTHVNAQGVIDYEVNASSADEIKSMFPVNMNRGHIAYDLNNDVLAFGGGGKVTLFNVSYDETTGAPTLVKWIETPMFNSAKPLWNVDGLAFDYAGDLYVMCASNERFYKYALPTADNTCVTPAKKAQVIVKEAPAPVKYTVTLENNIEQDSVYLEGVGMVAVTEGAGEYEAGEEVEIRAHQLGEYYFIGWADENGEIITKDLRYVFTITEDVTYTAMYATLLSVTSTDLDLSTPGHLKGTDPMFQFGMLTIDLVLGELDDEEGVYAIVPETSVLSAGEVKFQIEEGVAFVDAEENTVEAMVSVTFEGQLFVFYIEMSAAVTAETIDVTIENATVNITEYETGFGGGKATELVVSADWVYEADELTYTVEVVIAEFDPTATSGEYTASFFVQGEGDASGMTEEAEVTVAIEGGKVIVTGEGIQAYNDNVYNLTISGTMPVEDEPATGVDNLNGAVAPVKMIENGQLIVIKDGVKFNAQGAVVK